MRRKKTIHNKVDPLEPPRYVQSEVQKIKWDKEIPDYKSVKQNAIKFAKEAQAEAKRKKNKNITSEKVMRGKVAQLFFKGVLGYSSIGERFNYMENKTAVDSSRRADGLIGEFKRDDEISNEDLMVKAVIEWEDSSYEFDTSEEGRGVTQGFGYQAKYRWHRNQQKYVIVSNFLELRLYGSDERTAEVFDLTKLDQEYQLRRLLLFLHASRFAPVGGKSKSDTFYAKEPEDEQKSVTADAAAKLGELSNKIQAMGYSETETNIFMTRILFALFADDTTIMDGKFQKFLTHKVIKREDGTNTLGQELNVLFQVLNTPVKERGVMFAEYADFPYINGNLFSNVTIFPSFTNEILDDLIAAGNYDWSRINPIIFGNMFEGALNNETRRDLGAHFTSEVNIRKTIDSLFLNNLYTEFNVILDRGINVKRNLIDFKKKLANLRIMDPACGSGNFLIVAYRELRRLEHAVVKELFKLNGLIGQQEQMELLSANYEVNAKPDSGFTKNGDYTEFWKEENGDVPLIQVEVSQFYGIEIQDYAVDVARVGMWLEDHLMNMEASKEFFKTGQFIRIPLHTGAHIICANALRYDWSKLVSPNDLDYIIGNPPFIGLSSLPAKDKELKKQQKQDIALVFGNLPKKGKLDYVTAWYEKATKYMRENVKIKAAFVSTNSITQGEQVGVLWKHLIEDEGQHIIFAYRSFVWDNAAQNKAHVHCVIVGFSLFDSKSRPIIYDENGNRHFAEHINGYLLDYHDVYIKSRKRKPPLELPEMHKGSQPTDGGGLTVTAEAAQDLLNKYPQLRPYIKPYIGSNELIKGKKRYCLWLKDASPSVYRKIPEIKERFNIVIAKRKSSPTDSVRLDDVKTPYIFTQIRQPNTDYIAVPEVSSEGREYIPIAFLSKDIIASNKLYLISSTEKWIFAVLSSSTHMAWMRTVAGRLETRYSYSPAVYTNFPWISFTTEQKKSLCKTAQAILDARALYSDDTLADLYDPEAMPIELRKAHNANDKVVFKAYGLKPSLPEREIVEHLFEMYEERNEKKK
ncbi:class I SAM-dependent DNA methyltransferase [Limosilactobacillus reuteri subsp. suis]|uniref:class I SAM-dependent DNA methyltransferase n=1 Tax=Limosilactobacillus reuteri TaxID=1598 RepID=UPI003991315F